MLRQKNNVTELKALQTNQGITNDGQLIEKEVCSFYKDLYKAEGDIDIDDNFY